MKKRYFKVFLFFLVFISLFGMLTSCDKKQKHWTNTIENYESSDAMDLFLKKGESIEVDLKAHFKDVEIEISEIVAHSSNQDVFLVNNQVITGAGMGQARLEVEIYSEKKDMYYYTVAAFVYVVDLNHPNLIELHTPQDLIDMNQHKNGFFILKNDIDLKDVLCWQPIGNLPLTEQDASSSNDFKGIFLNPQGHKIKNLTIPSSKMLPKGIYGGVYGGFFGRLENAYIDGMILENVYIDLTDFDGRGASGAGGIASASVNSVIRNCRVEGTIVAQDRCGGIIGGSSWGKILHCSFDGNVKSTKHAAGGIAGFGYIVKNCSVKGTIEGTYASGGILGFKTSEYILKECLFEGKLLGDGHKNESIGYPYN